MSLAAWKCAPGGHSEDSGKLKKNRCLSCSYDQMQIFLEKQAAEKKQGWVLGNFMFFRMHRISDIYFVGGFGTVQWVDVVEYASTIPDSIVLHEPQKTLQACPFCSLIF